MNKIYSMRFEELDRRHIGRMAVLMATDSPRTGDSEEW